MVLLFFVSLLVITTREYPIVKCMKHGRGRGYRVCVDVPEGAKAARVVRATEKGLGEALCNECRGKRLTTDDLVVWWVRRSAESHVRSQVPYPTKRRAPRDKELIQKL